jgi:hypothetical protein
VVLVAVNDEMRLRRRLEHLDWCMSSLHVLAGAIDNGFNFSATSLIGMNVWMVLLENRFQHQMEMYLQDISIPLQVRQ